MREIKVGEYVRTKKGIIGILEKQYTHANGMVEYPEPQEWAIKTSRGMYVVYEANMNDDIVNHSKDIIDLVTMEDIFKIKEDNIIAYIGFTNSYVEEYADFIEQVKNKKIELLEVLTKEQFLANSYKVGE